MITYGMTAGNDNAIIWLVEIETSTPIYLCSGFNTSSVSLSTGSETRVYTNGIQKGSLSVYPQSIPGENAGGFGSRNGFTFVIANYGSYDLNDFYPASGGYDIIMKPARLGFIWSGADETADITWIYEGEIENFESRPDGLYFDVAESSFLDFVQLPPYLVQKDTDDKVSYFPQAPKDSIGKALPVVYGNFTAITFEYGKHRLMPALLVHQSFMIYAGACHAVNYTYEDYDSGKDRAFIYASGFDSYLELIPSTGSTQNNVNGYAVTILPSTRTSSQYVKGRLICWSKLPGGKTDITDLANLFSNYPRTDFTLPDKKQIQFIFAGDDSEELGTLGVAASDVTFQVTWTTSVDGEQRTIELKFWNQNKSGGAGYSTTVTDNWSDADSNRVTSFDFGNYTAGMATAKLPWDLREILQLGFTINNISGDTPGSTSGDITIVSAALILQNINIYNFGKSVNVNLGGILGGILLR